MSRRENPFHPLQKLNQGIILINFVVSLRNIPLCEENETVRAIFENFRSLIRQPCDFPHMSPRGTNFFKVEHLLDLLTFAEEVTS